MSRPKLKVFRDPIYTNISFDTTNDLYQLVLRLLDTPQVQRLRHIRQLALGNTVYHGAEHSRFSHTLGVVHLAKQMYDNAILAGEHTPNETEYATVLASAMLHDIGHPPFSHAVEKVLGVRHEKLTLKLIQEPSEVNDILNEYGGDEFIDSVSRHIDGKSDAPTTAIISSQLDADRLDYVLRDGYHAGVPNARFDLHRILQTVELDNSGLVFGQRSVYAIEGYFIARYHLYLQLYFHKTNRAAETILRSVLRRAKYLRDKEVDLGPLDPAVIMMFSDKGTDVALRLNDHDLWSAFRIWCKHEDPILQDLSRRLLTRQYFKTMDINPITFYEEQKPHIDELASQQGFDPEYYIVVDSAKDTPYQIASITSHDDPITSIRIRDDKGKVGALENHSPLIRQLQEQVTNRVRVCYPEQIREDVKRIFS